MNSTRNNNGRRNKSLNSRRISPLEKGKILRGRRIVRRVLKEGHMARKMKTPRSSVVAAIALVLRTTTKEDAHNRPRRELGMLNGRKEHKTDTTKGPQKTIGRCTRTKTLKWGDSRKNSRWSAVDEIDGGHNSFSLEMPRD